MCPLEIVSKMLNSEEEIRTFVKSYDIDVNGLDHIFG